MLFITVLALFATSAFAAPQVDVKHLENVIDIAIAEIAKSNLKVVDGISLKGLESLKRTQCAVKEGVFTCTAVADATISSPEAQEQKVLVKIPVSALLKGELFDQFLIGEVEIEEVTDGLFGFWKKVKNAVSKAAKAVEKTVVPIVTDAAKAAVSAKASDLAGKAVAAVLVG